MEHKPITQDELDTIILEWMNDEAKRSGVSGGHVFTMLPTRVIPRIHHAAANARFGKALRFEKVKLVFDGDMDRYRKHKREMLRRKENFEKLSEAGQEEIVTKFKAGEPVDMNCCPTRDMVDMDTRMEEAHFKVYNVAWFGTKAWVEEALEPFDLDEEALRAKCDAYILEVKGVEKK